MVILLKTGIYKLLLIQIFVNKDDIPRVSGLWSPVTTGQLLLKRDTRYSILDAR